MAIGVRIHQWLPGTKQAVHNTTNGTSTVAWFLICYEIFSGFQNVKTKAYSKRLFYVGDKVKQLFYLTHRVAGQICTCLVCRVSRFSRENARVQREVPPMFLPSTSQVSPIFGRQRKKPHGRKKGEPMESENQQLNCVKVHSPLPSYHFNCVKVHSPLPSYHFNCVKVHSPLPSYHFNCVKVHSPLPSCHFNCVKVHSPLPLYQTCRIICTAFPFLRVLKPDSLSSPSQILDWSL